MSSKENKPQIYYLIRRGWYGQLNRFCDGIIGKKGKDPVTVYWKAFAMGMNGNVTDCLRLLESFQSRRDMQFAVSIALLFFHKRAPFVDREAVDSLSSELSVAEDVTKEAGMILAARFCLFTGDLKEATRIAQTFLTPRARRDRERDADGGAGVSTAFELEAICIEQWCALERICCSAGNKSGNGIDLLGGVNSSSSSSSSSVGPGSPGSGGMSSIGADQLRQLQLINERLKSSSDTADVDSMMLWAKSRLVINMMGDVLNILNQVIAMFPWFLPALADKTLLLATAGEWDQALDTAQRLLDADNGHLDALKVVAIHAFTQESQPHDALQKLEDLDAALQAREPLSPHCAMDLSSLFSSTCSRQPRALQICVRMLERVLQEIAERDRDRERDGGRNSSNHSNSVIESRLLCRLGIIQVMQGAGMYEKAMKSFRESTRKDPNSTAALQGMILCQLCEGLYEDAEGQIELMTLMQSDSGTGSDPSSGALGYEFEFLRAMLMKGKKNTVEHMQALDRCRELYLRTVWEESITNASQLHVMIDYYTTAPHDGDEGGAGAWVSGSMGRWGGDVLGASYNNYFANLLSLNPDFLMLMAIDYLSHMEAGASTSSLIPSTSSIINGSTSGSLKSELARSQQEMDAASAQQHGNGGTAAMDVLDGAGTNGAPSLMGEGGPGSGFEITSAVQAGMDLLNRVLRTCPGMICAYVELARCYSALCMYDEASNVLQQCLSLSPSCSPVLVTMAKVEVSRCNTAAADRVLEQALACDFSIRASPLFRLVKVIVRAQQGRLDEALTEIESLLASPDFGFTLSSVASGGASGAGQADMTSAGMGVAMGNTTSAALAAANYSDSLRLTDDDRVSAFVAYASLLSKARRLKEANKVLSHAKVIFVGTAQEVSILVASSQLCVERSDFDTAIRMLDKIAEDSPTYTRAQLIKADILLNNHHDKEGFTKCYRQLADRDPPTSKNYAMLGEAYLRILNPEAAIDAMERAYQLDPTNGRLRGRIGRALVATHEYHRAVEFYETAIREISKQQSGATGGAATTAQGADGGPGRTRSNSGAGIPGIAGMGFGHGSGGNSPKTGPSSAKSNDIIVLSHDLAKLYIKLGRTESAIRVLTNVLHLEPKETLALRQNVTTLSLLTKVQELHAPGEVLALLQEAHGLQKELILKVRSGAGSVSSSAETLETEKAALSDICVRLGTCYAETNPTAQSHPDTHSNTRMNIQQDLKRAEQYFSEALQHNPQDTKAMFGLAKLFHRAGDVSQCIAFCRKILSANVHSAAGASGPSAFSQRQGTGQRGRANPSLQLSSTQDAAVLLSQVLFQSAEQHDSDEGKDAIADVDDDGVEDFDKPKKSPKKASGKAVGNASTQTTEAAIEPLQKFLAARPNNYRVLEICIGLLRRAGRLEDALEYLKEAELSDRRCHSHAGFHYCQGLYAQFTNDVGKAIGEFNLARKDEDWGPKALTHMVELYLNPDQEGAWEEKEAGPLDESTRANIAAAEELLQELKPRAKDVLRFRVLENYWNLSTRNKANVERAMQSFIEILEADQDYLPAVLGMATGFMIEKNQHKARNLLKRVGKMEMSQHDGEDFEKANLLLAKFYIDKGKNDLAQELCKKTLVQNKSCSQAWEILGLIMEKDSNYELAADCYQKAWKLEFEASASVGFKLAFSYLKCKQYVNAVDVCEKVLAQYPDYPRISEEILKKAQQSFRTSSNSN